MVTRWEPDDRCHNSLEVGEWHVETNTGGPAWQVWHEHYDSQADIKRDSVWMSSAEWARRVAWKWYWRRAFLCARIEHATAAGRPPPAPTPLWPHMLTWSDDYVAIIEALLRGEVEVAR